MNQNHNSVRNKWNEYEILNKVWVSVCVLRVRPGGQGGGGPHHNSHVQLQEPPDKQKVRNGYLVKKKTQLSPQYQEATAVYRDTFFL